MHGFLSVKDARCLVWTMLGFLNCERRPVSILWRMSGFLNVKDARFWKFERCHVSKVQKIPVLYSVKYVMFLKCESFQVSKVWSMPVIYSVKDARCLNMFGWENLLPNTGQMTQEVKKWEAEIERHFPPWKIPLLEMFDAGHPAGFCYIRVNG